MKRIISKLMDYGIPFQYDNFGSQGEEIISHELGVIIKDSQGILTMNYEGETETSKSNDKGFSLMVMRVDEICIEQTASF